MNTKKAYNEGRHDALMGNHDCPYDDDTLASAWYDGFEAGVREQRRLRRKAKHIDWDDLV